MTLLLEPRREAAAPAPQAPQQPSPVVHRVRMLAACLGFVGLALSQEPGRIVPDTKLDLVVDPLAFLARALHLWEPEGFAGQVQNQAYGYLFPMGPFFVAGDALGLPMWVVQRLWWAVLLSVAFLGVVTLAERLRIGTASSQILAGLAYALAPRMVSSLGAVSVEVLPMALAPWVLVPLVGGARGGSPRRAALLSGLVVFCVGGVNAAATAAVMPLAAIWLLTRPAGPRRRQLMTWWAASVALATAWWVGPLLLLGRYSPPFLNHIETASATTAPGEITQALRGTTQWIAGFATPLGPVWPAGWALLHDALPVLATVVLAAAGLFALTRPDLPHQRWLVLGALTGLAMLTAGHTAAVEGVFAAPLQAALDGPLAPLRNVHKFDPVLRLPLALGIAHLVRVAMRRAHDGPPRVIAFSRVPALVVPVLVIAAIAGAASPAIAARLASPTGFVDVPGYWQQTADRLAATGPSGRALLLPASSFGVYIWGSPGDEPLQPLADSPWTVRNAVPLTPAGHIRMLDAVETRLARGEGGPGLTRFLARAGISHLVVRNDLDTGAAGATRPILVHRAIADTPGITRIATFGPELFTSTALPGLVTDSAATVPLPAVEIFEVADPAPRAYTVPLADAVPVLGGPEAVLALADRDLLGNRPAVLPDGPIDAQRATDPAGPTVGDTMVSDALMRRERTFGRLSDAVSAGLSAADPLRLDTPARDYLLAGHEAQESVVRIDGAALSASSSASDADSYGGARVEHQPFAAVDGNQSTAWRPAVRFGDRPEWWRIETDAPIAASEVSVLLEAELIAEVPSRVRLRTDAGEVTVPLERTTVPQRLALPPGPTRSLTIEAAPEPGSPVGPSLGLAEVELPGVAVTRTVVTPTPTGPVAAYAFDAANPARSGCVPDPAGTPRCGPELTRGAEEPAGIHRELTVAAPAEYDMAVTARPRPGAALDALLVPDPPPAPQPIRRRQRVEPPAGALTATASSQAVPDPRAGAAAAVDADPATSWLAAPDDPDPTLTVQWSRPRTFDNIRVTLTGGVAAAAPGAVRITIEGDDRTVLLEPDGTARFAPLTTDRLTLRFPLRSELSSFDPYTRGISALGVGVSEVVVPDVVAPDPAAAVEIPCGSGPEIRIDGQPTATAVRTTVADLRALRPVSLIPCPQERGAEERETEGRNTDERDTEERDTEERDTEERDADERDADERDADERDGEGEEPAADDGADPVRLAAGVHRFSAASTDAFAVTSATLTRRAAPTDRPAPERTLLPTAVWEAEHRTVEVPARTEPTLLVVPENANPGWTVTLAGAPLPRRMVDGWQQGYVLPPGPAGTVELDFVPGTVYRMGMVGGGVAVLVLIGLLLVPARAAVPPSSRPRRNRSVGVAVVAVAGLAVVGGPVAVGALAVLAYLAAAMAGDKRRHTVLGLVAACAVLAAGALYLADRTLAPGDVWFGEPVRQVLGAVAVAAVVAALLPVPAGVRAGTRLRQRLVSGRSSSR